VVVSGRPAAEVHQAVEVVSMSEGTVKWFNDSKGFGFIQSESGQDVFVHHSEIQADGYRSLPEGARVEFELAQSEKGPRATNVRILQ